MFLVLLCQGRKMQPLPSLLYGGFGEAIKCIHGEKQYQTAWVVWLVELVGTLEIPKHAETGCQPDNREGSNLIKVGYI
jgi:hypothetical protein